MPEFFRFSVLMSVLSFDGYKKNGLLEACQLSLEQFLVTLAEEREFMVYTSFEEVLFTKQ